MELVKDIYFNTDKLVENTNVKVSYTGKFYQGNNDKVFIHYGYGKNWENVQEVEMKKTDLGYQTELNLKGNETINFCFKNQNNEWDNNLGKNYIFNIEKASSNNLGKTTVGSAEKASFFGKTFGEEKSFSDVYFNAKIEPEIKDIEPSIDAELAEGIIFSAPNSFDTELETFSSFESIAGVTPGEEIASSINADLASDLGFSPISNVSSPVIPQSGVTSTALAITCNPSFAWTKKVKDTVVKFLASVPTFISGNYKRIIGKNK